MVFSIAVSFLMLTQIVSFLCNLVGLNCAPEGREGIYFIKNLPETTVIGWLFYFVNGLTLFTFFSIYNLDSILGNNDHGRTTKFNLILIFYIVYCILAILINALCKKGLM